MYDETFIMDGFNPTFALLNKSIINIVMYELQLKLFNNRVDDINVKSQILESDNDNFLLILFIKDTKDDESLSFILDNLVEQGNIIHTDTIKLKDKGLE